ncbi:hypothetical protein J4Q44_G00344780 [Coregonus suidteri]|uniref:Transposase n=1 Tax=Coregonus suidteri TaxID=861788 RepID=A0AAN8QMP3_9TELE
MLREAAALKQSTRKHVHHLKKYGELTVNTLKRKHAPKTPSTIKHSTLLKTVSQKSIDKAVVKYGVQRLQPFSVVEQEPFREFVQDLQPNSKILSRPTLRSRIDEASTEMKKVTEAMRGVDHIATDCWSARRQSFIGVTAHWIDPDSLNRCSAALACKRLRGSHTFDVLAGALNYIHSEFEIRAAVPDCYNVELLVHGCRKTPEDRQRQRRGGRQSSLHRLRFQCSIQLNSPSSQSMLPP